MTARDMSLLDIFKNRTYSWIDGSSLIVGRNDESHWQGLLMAYTLPLTAALRKARWKVKIRDKETREPPHVTIIRGTDAWRIDLRTREFMDDDPDPAEVPDELIELITDEATWQQLCNEWDRMYPNNPVSEDEDQE
jgi:hypothetical protein